MAAPPTVASVRQSITNLFAENGVGGITPLLVREVLLEMLTLIDGGGSGGGDGDMIGDGTILTSMLADGAVTTPKIAAQAIVNALIASGAVSLDKLGDDVRALITEAGQSGTVADGSVSTAKLADGAATLAKLATNSVDGTKIVDGSVATAELANNAATMAKVGQDVRDAIAAAGQASSTPADGSVTTAKIADQAVTFGKFDLSVPPALSKAILFRTKTFNLKDYGAVPYSTATGDEANNVTAWNALATDVNNATTGTILIPNEGYNFNKEIAIICQGGVSLVGAGSRSTMAMRDFTATTDTILLDAGTSSGPALVEGLRIIGTNVASMSGKALLKVRGSGTMNGPRISGLTMFGDPSFLPGKFLHVVNPQQTTISDVVIDGQAGDATGYGTTSNGILVSGDTLATDVKLRCCAVLRVATGYQIQAGKTGPNGSVTIEGAAFVDCLAIGVQQGALLVGNGYQVPGHAWKGGHINARVAGIWCQSWSQFFVSDLLCYLDCFDNSSTAMLLLDNSKRCHAHDNYLEYINQSHYSGSTPQGVVMVQQRQGSTQNSMDGNRMDLGLSPSASGMMAQDSSCPANTSWAMNNTRLGLGSGTLGTNIVDRGNNVALNTN